MPGADPKERRQSAALVLFIFAVKLAVLLMAGERYGYMSDELYILDAADRLAPGYVDFPPLVVWLVAGLKALGIPLNLYAQIWLVLLIGISAKTAILIVEFAKQLRETEGKSVMDATVEASGLRFRAVLMTVASFVLGVLPLVLATGAGAASRVSMGVTVFFGMLASAVLGTLMVPAAFASVQYFREWVKGKRG